MNKSEHKELGLIVSIDDSLHITVIDGFARKALYRVMTSCDHSYVTEAVEGAGGDAVQMVVATLSMVKIRIGASFSMNQ